MPENEGHATLTSQAKALADTVEKCIVAIDGLDRRSTRNERVVVATVFGLALDVVLSILVAFLVSNLFGVNGQLQAAIAREAVVRQQALCPLYGLLLGSYNPTSRAEGKDRDSYNAAFVTLRDGYNVLDCVNPIVPPRLDQPPATIPPK